MSAGDLTTWIPAAAIAFIFSSAVPFPPSRRRRLARDESDDRLADALRHEGGRLLLRAPADLADHHDRLRAGILAEEAQRLGMVGADDGVAADPDAGGLADAESRELVHRFVGERP